MTRILSFSFLIYIGSFMFRLFDNIDEYISYLTFIFTPTIIYMTFFKINKIQIFFSFNFVFFIMMLEWKYSLIMNEDHHFFDRTLSQLYYVTPHLLTVLFFMIVVYISKQWHHQT